MYFGCRGGVGVSRPAMVMLVSFLLLPKKMPVLALLLFSAAI
jgi:hypothetical protein